jgi:hypothetical protein
MVRGERPKSATRQVIESGSRRIATGLTEIVTPSLINRCALRVSPAQFGYISFKPVLTRSLGRSTASRSFLEHEVTPATPGKESAGQSRSG